MKKIMFNDKYGLTQAVLDGRKTMTRREIKLTPIKKKYLDLLHYINIRNNHFFVKYAQYQIGEVVAIAQSYNVADDILPYRMWSIETYRQIEKTPGWNNKMFVKAKLMPHHIRIANIRVERLQDISYKDCTREGIKEDWSGFIVGNTAYKDIRRAFAALIDKVSGKRTWNRNPWVFIYEFELID